MCFVQTFRAVKVISNSYSDNNREENYRVLQGAKGMVINKKLFH